jgi:hypothetical protein
MDLDFGHGFVPRIGSENYLAVDRCLGPDDLFAQSLDLPWAVIDGAWAEQKPELLGTLRSHGTKIIVDTHAWRFRAESAFDVARLRSASWAPTAPISLTDATAQRRLVEASLLAQAQLESDVYLVPGWLPHRADEDLRSAYGSILEIVGGFDDVPPRPLVLFVGGHSQGIDELIRLVDDLPHFVSGIYLQLTPMKPMKDGPSKLAQLTSAYLHAKSLGFTVMAGHGGAATPILRALGIDAADSGLATGEAFDLASSRRKKVKTDEEKSNRGGRRSRMYFSQFGMSLEAAAVERLLAVPAAAPMLRTCRLPCHRFSGSHLLERAREHSLRARIEEAQLVNSLPPSMRPSAVAERLRARRSALAAVNGALEAAGQQPLDVKHADNHLTWLSRASAVKSAA